MTSVVLGYCHRPDIPHLFHETLLNVYRYFMDKQDFLNTIIHERAFFISQGRNRVVEQFLDTDGEWLLFVDDDVLFGPGDIEKIYAAGDKDKAPIVAGLYFSKLGTEKNIYPTWLCWKEDEQSYRTCSEFKTSLEPIDACGMGFTLIHRSVLEWMKTLRIEEENSGALHDTQIWFDHEIDAKGGRYGEDVTFCRRAKRAGFPIFGYTDIALTHAKLYPLSGEMFLDQNKLMNLPKEY